MLVVGGMLVVGWVLVVGGGGCWWGGDAVARVYKFLATAGVFISFMATAPVDKYSLEKLYKKIVSCFCIVFFFKHFEKMSSVLLGSFQGSGGVQHFPIFLTKKYKTCN